MSNKKIKECIDQLSAAGLAQDLIANLEQSLYLFASKHGSDEPGFMQHIEDQLASMIKIEPPFLFNKSTNAKKDIGEKARMKVIVMLGNSGAGKTTVLGCLAARLIFRALPPLKTVMATAFIPSVCGTDLMGFYHGIFGAEYCHLTDPSHFSTILSKADFSLTDILFFDTPGCSHYDYAGMIEIFKYMEYLKEFEPITFLVIPANMSLGNMRDMIKSFGRLKISHLIFTQTDETSSFGALFSALAKSRIPLAYISRGRDVPYDLIIPRSKQMVRSLFFRPDESLLSSPFTSNDRRRHYTVNFFRGNIQYKGGSTCHFY